MNSHSNKLFSKNVDFFFKRFSPLAEFLGLSQEDLFVNQKIDGEANPQFLLSDDEIEILPSKQIVDGNPIFTAKSNGKFLHSLYNPIREAEQIVDNAKKQNSLSNVGVFFGFGLGHAVITYAKKFPNDSLLIVEPNPKVFFTSLKYVDWTPVFSLKNVVIALATGADIVVSLIENFGGLEKCTIISNPNYTIHATAYFFALNSQIERNKNKDKINNATLQRFSNVWKRNIFKNLEFIKNNKEKINSISKYKNSFVGKNVVILAAGPTLSEILPHLSKIKENSVIIAVDTALRACLRFCVEPDFVVLCDPQYYAYRHVAGLSSLSSILITEIAAYPPVFRFPCKSIALCASNVPLEKFDFEKKIIEEDRKRGILSSGGSVSTTAWDFARFCGAEKIYFAGLDLGFPKNETHIRGSTFEEIIHTSSNLLQTAETSGVSALFGANMIQDSSYKNEKILTDNRMKMFAWWFESKCTEYQNIKSYSFSEDSLKIPGFSVISIGDYLKL